MAERLTIDDQRANAHLYQVLNDRGIEDGWGPRIKEFNYRSLLKLSALSGTPVRGSRVLDVGCGTGDFFPILKSEGVGEYLGLDLLSSSIEKARERYTDGAFRQGDFLVEPYRETFDFVFLSGALTTKIPSGNSKFLMKMITRMGQVAECGFAFNYLTGTAQEVDESEVALTHVYPRALVALICDNLYPKASRFVQKSQIGSDFQDTVFVIK